MTVWTFGPPRRGWRFSPKDEELIDFLRERNAAKQSEIEEIPDVDIYKFEPKDLPGKSLIKTDDLEWFFFSPFKRKYQRGCRKDRMTNTGYWKATGQKRNINSRSSKLIGKKRTLVFYEGRSPRFKRTNWIAHEYQTIENGVDGMQCEEGAFVIIRLTKKLDGDANSNCNDVERNDITPANSNLLSADNTTVGATDETDGMVNPTLPGEGHCTSHISARLDACEDEATEVNSSKNPDQPECSSPSDLWDLSPLRCGNFGTGWQCQIDSHIWDLDDRNFVRRSCLDALTSVEEGYFNYSLLNQ